MRTQKLRYIYMCEGESCIDVFGDAIDVFADVVDV